MPARRPRRRGGGSRGRGGGLVGGLRRLQYLRCVGAHLVEHHVCAEHEVAAVPQGALTDQAGGAGGVGLLQEALDHPGARLPRLAGQGLARLDVTVGGGRARRHETEGHDVAGLRAGAAVAERREEGGVVAHEMVGGEDQHQRVRLLRGGVERRDRDGGGRILSGRLEDDIGGQPRLGELLGDDEAGIVGREDGGAGEQARVRHAGGGGLEGGAVGFGQRNELLREALARGGPQPGARAAAQDDRMNEIRGFTRHRPAPALEQ